MKLIVLLFVVLFELSARVLKSPLVSVDKESMLATIKVDKIDLGMSGFVYHEIAHDHSSILNNALVVAYDREKKIATIKLSPYTGLRNNSLPTGKWTASVGDTALFAFGYNRGLLIAPNEETYHRVTKSVKIEWVHPDLFATILYFRGHPTPMKADFIAMSDMSSVGLVFIYLDQKVYMIDSKSFHILGINNAPIVEDSIKLPFYSRIDSISSKWWQFWGEENDELEEYAPHYYALLVKNNRYDERLYEAVKNGGEKLHHLLNDFKIGN